ncbi:hypothetical protein LEP1GSC103_1042 [Leptospira borgpetersenii serovar Javanica str. UI 09931]|uniref:Uncharacterized protein n=3 Tax=Leptospira borgpetersenii TaxID=174 RepID=A0A0S2IU92_LEPBO|nr:hypothetical protein LBBP_02981 [Leptospira borgpetersenii serovar Ballum]EKP15646.1 hypothetical protein LEP1GSC128_0073 [Leptospira borgpetersenii str. 200801926]EKQ91603.1 hypothetical protein LEP1GSC101_0093 [Leptospira borgpetersenii str. UI 09149]EKR00711.1 hypothetical protein LEP1GSC121_0658 [Leptospira borgpetersenii serovar Castellonis str. 200801910]ENO62512.1 hypothetical protein LEP1GSC191_3874 [Leptospira borgpetersenii serovar Mini str. 201000851]EPG58518.1 hypothetical prote
MVIPLPTEDSFGTNSFEFVRKIVICGNSHILRIDLQSLDPNLFLKK